MNNCKAVSTPIIKDGISETGKENNEDNQPFPYRSAVGSLMYLMTGTRPDIAYAVGVVSRTLENPSKEDVTKVKRIFRYLQGTINQGIVYKAKINKGKLIAYSDADHAGDLKTGRSTTGTVCLYAGGAVSWLSQLQTTVAISTTEAELVAASEATREAIWLKRLVNDIIELNEIPELKVDNEAAIRLAHNPEYHRRTKHIRIRHFFVREKVQEEEICVNKVSSEEQLADAMTKPLSKQRLKELLLQLGLM